MDPENFAAHQTTRTTQEYTRVKNMNPEYESAHRLRHAALEKTRLRDLSI